MRKQVLIVAPHMDDEIIGCYEVLVKSKGPIIIFTDMDEVPGNYKKNCTTQYYGSEWKDGEMGFFPNLPKDLIDKEVEYYFPDPIYETHPEHRKQGALGEELFRKGYDVIFYNTNMTAPYIHKVKNWEKKVHLLNKWYHDKSSLWKYDYKYFLFEGYCKWIL